jgi:nucleotide-binding universal stress UspA family protein
MSTGAAVGGHTIKAPSLIQPGSILVGVDGSNDGLRAVDYAAAEARVRRTPLHIVTAVPPATATAFGLALPVLTTDHAAAAAEQATAAAARRALASGLLPEQVSAEVVLGYPGDVLAEMSKGATAVVIGRRGLSGLERVFAGSTSVAVGAKAHCPVMVVPHGWRAPVAGGRAVGVGIDGSAESVPALAAAYAEAASRKTELRVIYAYQPPFDTLEGLTADENTLADWLAQAELRVAETLAGWHDDYPDVVVQRHFVRAHPVRVLVEESHDLDLLYVGTNGSSAMSGLVLGTVARAVVAGSACPVALVRKGSDPTGGYGAREGDGIGADEPSGRRRHWWSFD